MPTPVEEVMTIDVVAVTEETTYKDIVELMHRRHVAAVPVLDAAGQVRGVVSQTDLLVKEADPDASETIRLSPARRAEQRKAMGVAPARWRPAFGRGAIAGRCPVRACFPILK